jgi:ubiquinol-cytochrome c reductase cytochrome b subunit
MVGVVIFLVSIVTAFTGYISQQNLDAQWIAVNAKDASTPPASAPSSIL